MLKAFRNIGVSQAMLEKYLDKKAADLLKEDLVDLRGIYKAINDAQSKITDYFKEATDTKVTAEDDKKAAIIAANKPPVPANVNEETGEIKDEPVDHQANVDQVFTPPADEEPKESVADKAKRKYGPKQATLVDDDTSS
jgi:hypothetical protein